MGEGFDECLAKGKLQKYAVREDIIKKELSTAEYDLQRAEKSFTEGDSKWATVQAYYSMFHSAKALVYKAGFREKSHHCLAVALEEFYAKAGKIDKKLASMFSEGMALREDADYGFIYSKTGAEYLIKGAKLLLEQAKKLSQ